MDKTTGFPPFSKDGSQGLFHDMDVFRKFKDLKLEISLKMAWILLITLMSTVV